jgi:hypothetical protein
MIVLGVLLLIGAGVLAVSAISGNSGAAHPLPGGVAVLGYHLDMSVGRLFTYGLILGAAAMLGLVMLFAGTARISRSRARTRQTLAAARQDNVRQDGAPVRGRKRGWPGQPPVVETSSDDEPTLVDTTVSQPRRRLRNKPEVVETTQTAPYQEPVIVGSASRSRGGDPVVDGSNDGS